VTHGKDPAIPRSVTWKPQGTSLATLIPAEAIGFAPTHVWHPTPGRREQAIPFPAPVPKTIRIGNQNTDDAAASLNPTPYAVVAENGDRRALVMIAADAGWHRWNYGAFEATPEGVKVGVDFEGHTPLSSAAKHVDVLVLPAKTGEDRYALVARGLRKLYPGADRWRSKPRPKWWDRPIYCGWGDQVAWSLLNEGPGPEMRACAYCIQGLYERWIRRLDEANLPIGTITIDAGWSPGGVWEPYKLQWPDLKGFIAREHEKGRKVLLWIATWFHDGLPDEWCIRVGGTRLVADPMNKQYRRFLRDQITRLLSEDGLNADGFKIDQLAYVPCESRCWSVEHCNRVRMLSEGHPKISYHDKKWGSELLLDLQGQIYDAAKAAKPDALVTSSTIHPIFAGTYDMMRLHDTRPGPQDVVEAMKARADVCRAVFPHLPIDADDWVHTDYDRWLTYTLESYRLGTPCLFYSEHFVNTWRQEPTTRPIELGDLKKIAKRWREKVWSGK
jgi:hypothetical protein